MKILKPGIRWFITGLLLIGACRTSVAARYLPPKLTPGPGTVSTGKGSKVATWHEDLDYALALATTEYKPVFALFTSDSCPWCQRLKEQSLTDPEVVSLLESFVLAEVNVSRNPEAGAPYQVRGVPAVRIFSSDGSVQVAFAGYQTAAQLVPIIRRALNPAFVEKKDTDYADLMQSLRDGSVPSNGLDQVMIFLGHKEKRQDVHDALMSIEPFPAEGIVALLQDRRLSVRLGALEILEEVAGTTHGFDPWAAGAAAAANADAMARWGVWSQNSTHAVEQVYTAMTDEQLTGYIQDLISENRERSTRAMAMIERGGASVAPALATFLSEHTDLVEGARNRIREVRYTVLLDDINGVPAPVLSHRLVFGTLDVKLKTMGMLPQLGVRAISILKEFLADENAIVRETAVDSLVSAGRWRVIDLLDEHIKREKDADVVYAILRALGGVKSRKGLKILTRYLDSPIEDHVIVALQSIGKIKSKQVEDDVLKCLDDSRWRVRVAALETVAQTRISDQEEKIAAMLNDKDDFVRFTAVKTLTSTSAKKVKKQLEEAFLKEDDLKGVIVSAFGSMDLALPPSFREALDGKDRDVLISVLDAMEGCSSKDLDIPRKLISHEDNDVACAAIRVVAARGMGDGHCRRALVNVLETRDKPRVRAALESITLNSRSDYAAMVWAELGVGSSGDSATAEEDGPLKDLVDAFMGRSRPEVKKPETTSEDLLSAFMEVEEVKPVEAEGSASMKAVKAAVEAWLDPARDAELRFQAANVLAEAGSSKALSVLKQKLDERPSHQRWRIASSLGQIHKEEALNVLAGLLRDPAGDVRSRAVESCLESKVPSSAGLKLVLDELLRPDTPLTPKQVYGYELKRALEAGRGKAIGREWISRTLEETTNAPLANMAIVMLEKCWRRGDESLLDNSLEADDPYRRRAAWHTLGACALSEFEARLDQVANDSAEIVRLVVPKIYTKESTRWVHYLDEDSLLSEYSYYSSYSSDRRRPLSAAVHKVMESLTGDESARVRVEAYFCLLSNRMPFDLRDFVKTMGSFPDMAAMRQRIGSYVAENYKTLGSGFKVLLPYLEGSRVDEENIAKVRKHFGLDEEDDWAELEVLSRVASTNEIQATFLDLPESAPPAGPTSNRFTLVYFTSAGCRDCERVQKMIGHLKESFPAMDVETHDIRKVAAMRLNEALCSRFSVPPAVRLVTPAVFSGGGYLIKQEIGFSRLGELLVKSSAVPDKDWYEIEEEELAQAEEAIGDRYSAIGIGIVTTAGMLDGVNPCAFATIIFLLSYLQVAKRTRKQIAQVGIAFIVGVFLAYYALGLGLIEIVARLSVLRYASRALNWIIAVCALVIMVLSIRDGIRCLRGRMADMTLQLPEFLKRRIHSTIRVGARHRRFVGAAFLMGVVISFLELACTGQVYAPTILFMLKTGTHRTGALSYLAVYNAAFILPLTVVFALACFGLTSAALTRWMQRHAAAVKFATALLFLLLVVVLLFGNELTAYLSGLGAS